MNKYAYAIKKSLPTIAIVLVMLVAVTILVYNRIATIIPPNHAIVFFYRTNVPGGQAAKWQEDMAATHPEIAHLEVQCFDTVAQAGNSGAGGTSVQTGWQIITARMSAGECDILIVDKERYEFLLSKGYLAPLENDLPEKALSSGDTVYGFDLQGMQLAGLSFPCKLEPNDRLESTAQTSEVVLCVMRDASQEARALAREFVKSAVQLPEPQEEEND